MHCPPFWSHIHLPTLWSLPYSVPSSRLRLSLSLSPFIFYIIPSFSITVFPSFISGLIIYLSSLSLVAPIFRVLDSLYNYYLPFIFLWFPLFACTLFPAFPIKYLPVHSSSTSIFRLAFSYRFISHLVTSFLFNFSKHPFLFLLYLSLHYNYKCNPALLAPKFRFVSSFRTISHSVTSFFFHLSQPPFLFLPYLSLHTNYIFTHTLFVRLQYSVLLSLIVSYLVQSPPSFIFLGLISFSFPIFPSIKVMYPHTLPLLLIFRLVFSSHFLSHSFTSFFHLHRHSFLLYYQFI